MHFQNLYPHNEPWVGQFIVVCAVAVHQLDMEGKLSKRDVLIDSVVVVRGVHPFHLNLGNNEEE